MDELHHGARTHQAQEIIARASLGLASSIPAVQHEDYPHPVLFQALHLPRDLQPAVASNNANGVHIVHFANVYIRLANRSRQCYIDGMALDTLGYTRTLEAAGVERRVAEAHADALRSIVIGELATKADLKAEIAALESQMIKYMVMQAIGIIGLLIPVMFAVVRMAH